MPNIYEVHVELTARSDGRIYARSPELPGLLLSDDDSSALLPLIPSSIEQLYKYEGRSVTSVTLESSTVADNVTSQLYEVEFGG